MVAGRAVEALLPPDEDAILPGVADGLGRQQRVADDLQGVPAARYVLLIMATMESISSWSRVAT